MVWFSVSGEGLQNGDDGKSRYESDDLVIVCLTIYSRSPVYKKGERIVFRVIINNLFSGGVEFVKA